MAVTSWQARLIEKASQQVQGIKEAYARLVPPVVIMTEPARDRNGRLTGGDSFIYSADPARILVRYEYLEPVKGILADLGFKSGDPIPIIDDILLLILTLPDDREHFKDEQPLLHALDHIDAALGEGIATPDHVLTVCDGIVSPCPATEPRPVDYDIEPHPGVCTGNSGAEVLIYIADTGLLQDADANHYWLQGVERAMDASGTVQPWDWDPPPTSDNQIIPSPYTGHGTFVAGVARCMAPQADVIVSNVFNVAGSQFESNLILDLKRALSLGVDIFHLSVAGPTRKDRPLIAFERWLKLVNLYKGTVCVVPAGNSGVRWPTWPSVFPQTVSVGALTADGRDRADFSNYGGWVDVYAPGRDLVNAYATGVYQYQDYPYTGQQEQFYGMARWSGTSFSTPIVSGLIAARMTHTGENAREAANALLREARTQAIPDVGAILLPCEQGDDHRCEPPARHCCACT